MLPETALSGILIRMPKSLEKKVLFNQLKLPDQKSYFLTTENTYQPKDC